MYVYRGTYSTQPQLATEMGLNIENEEVPTWGSSLPVGNVQEMVRRDSSCVPERYIRNHEDRPNDADVSDLSSNIPVIDLSLLFEEHEEELKKLDMACREWGFLSVLKLINISTFQVIHHGVAEEVLEMMKDAGAGFFELPFEEKNKYAMSSNDIQGYGHAHVVSEHKLDWTDALILVTYPHKYRKLECWPTIPLSFKDAIEACSIEVSKLAEILLGSLSLIMGMEKEALLGMHKEVTQGLRVNYYPTCYTPEHVLGLSPHSDASTITILMQDGNVDGLQIRHDKGWVPVKPIPNALIVNVGDVIEIWSNGKYKSIEHRAVTNKTKARVSFASFISPNGDVNLKPLDQMVDEQNSIKMYKEMKYGDYLRHSTGRRLEGKAHTQIAKFVIE